MIEIEVWSDFACPFCYIGKRHLEMALASASVQNKARVVFKSFELDPSAPKRTSESIYEVLAKKYGQSLEWARQANENVTRSAARVGVRFDMDKVVPTNTFDAHQLSQYAKQEGRQDEVVNGLFAAYFTEGKDLADPATLKTIATAAGLDGEIAANHIANAESEREVRQDQAEARELGVRGVPFFVFNGQFAISGAQPVEVFLEALKRAGA